MSTNSPKVPRLRDNPLMQVVDEIARSQGRLRQLFAEVRVASGLGVTDNLVLTSILEADKPPTVPQIGRSLGHPRQVIQRAVNQLENEGYIEKLPNPAHKRAPLLTATQLGTVLKQQADQHALQIAHEVLAETDEDRIARLADELRAARQCIENFIRRRDLES